MKRVVLLLFSVFAMCLMIGCGNGNKEEEPITEMVSHVPTEAVIKEPETEPSEEIAEEETEPVEELTKSMDAYQRFLSGEEGLYFDIYEMTGFDKNKAYMLNDFFKTKKENFETYLIGFSDLEYSFIDCGNDGIQELLIRYSLSDEMSEYEGDYSIENIIKLIDGRLEVCAEAVSHYRANEIINKYGVISGAFIDYAGANVWSSDRGVNTDGKLHSIFDSSTSYAEAIPGIYSGYSSDEPDFTELSGLCDELGDSFYVYSTKISYGKMKDKTIYSYKLSGSEENKNTIEAVFEKSGVTWYEYDEYDGIIRNTIEEFGLTDEEFYSDEPEFTPFPEHMSNMAFYDDISKEPWKKAYKDYLYGIMAGKEDLSDYYEVVSYVQGSASFDIFDITGDGVPELFVSPSQDPWRAYKYENGELVDLGSDYLEGYNPEK